MAENDSSSQHVADLETDYYLGSYQTCINKANSMPVTPESTYYLCLSYKALNKHDNLERLLKVEKYGEDNDDWTFLKVLQGDDTLDAKSVKQDDELSRLLLSSKYANQRDFAMALKVIDQFDSLRSSHAKITTYIMMHRLDLAEKQLEKMKKRNEQHPITELTDAIVKLTGGLFPSQAWRLALSLSERHRPTPLLNNLQTAAALCQSDYDSAKQLCESTLDMDNDNVEALINMVHILSKLRTPTQAALIERNLERLRYICPDHEYIKELDSIAAEMKS